MPKKNSRFSTKTHPPTIGLTWLLDLAIYLHGRLRIPGMAIFPQLQTLLPAFSANVLGLFFFTESPIYHR